MLIINADDWGRSRKDTDPILAAYLDSRITSVSAMVFMEDSERAARLAKEHGFDVGLHVNLSQHFTGDAGNPEVREAHRRVVGFLTAHRYAQLLYHPFLRRQFRLVYQAQAGEFRRLYDREPTHVDGHQHMHLCGNMLIDPVIPRGLRVRRTFSFLAGQKSLVNRVYRRAIDRRLAARYRLTDYFFALPQQLRWGTLSRAVGLARDHQVEIMTHPANPEELAFLTGAEGARAFAGAPLAPYAAL